MKKSLSQSEEIVEVLEEEISDTSTENEIEEEQTSLNISLKPSIPVKSAFLKRDPLISLNDIEYYRGFSVSKAIENVIPCLFVRSVEPSEVIMIYFHGNAEDIGKNKEFMTLISKSLSIHVLAVEYPGYGMYKGEPSEQAILSDAERVLEFVKTVLLWPSQNIIICGRSIGTGPSCYLASKLKSLGALALISPFTSIRRVVQDGFGKMGGVASLIVKERFPNIQRVAEIECPLFLLHGKRDTLIPYTHSKRLKEVCKSVKFAHFPKNMDHNEFRYLKDFIEPLEYFLKKKAMVLKD